MVSALFDTLLASVCVCVCVCVCFLGGGWFEKPPPPKISETNGRMTIKFLPGVKYHMEAKNPKTILTLFIA